MRSAEGRDPSGGVVRLLGARDDAAASVTVAATREVPPGAIGMLLEPAAAGDAGDRREPAVADREGREVMCDRNRFGKCHARSVRFASADVGGEPVPDPMRIRCEWSQGIAMTRGRLVAGASAPEPSRASVKIALS